jgi:hypothetical protein
VTEQLRQPERRFTQNLKSTSTVAARLRWSLDDLPQPLLARSVPIGNALEILKRYVHLMRGHTHFLMPIPELRSIVVLVT